MRTNLRHNAPFLLAILASLAALTLTVLAFAGAAAGDEVSPNPSTTPASPSPPPTSPTATTPEPAPRPPKPTVRTRIVRLPPTYVSDGTAPLRIRFSGALPRYAALPSLTPSVGGSWKVRGSSMEFTPSSTLDPCSTYTLTVWGRTAANGELPLAKRRTLTLQVGCPSLRALQQALSRLRYLPFELHSHRHANAQNARESRARAARYAYHPPSGGLVPYIPYAPGLWYGALDPTTQGALMVFQAQNGLAVTGSPDARTWETLLSDEVGARSDPHPYTFVTVSERIPETLQVHEGHHLVLSSPTNTGVPGATTQVGTFPIYARYTSTTMTGTNPDGSHYSDPGVPWVNYFNGGDAVHGFPRPSYGSPQSNGCVELPIGTAAQVYGMLSIGDLVIVSG